MVQIVLYPLTTIVFVILALSTMRELVRNILWRATALVVLVASLVIVLATPEGIVLKIPAYQVTSTAGPLLALDNADDDVYADLLMLSDSPEATKYPSDQLDQTSKIQPLYFQIPNKESPVLFMHPTSAITYALHLPANAYVETAITLNPDVWEKSEGDGVEFVVRVTTNNKQRELLRQTIDPIHNPEQRTWNEVLLDLHAYANQDILLCLETTPGPMGNVQFDWAGWREPAIVIR